MIVGQGDIEICNEQYPVPLHLECSTTGVRFVRTKYNHNRNL